MTIIIPGRIPSKKNSKFMARRGDRTYLLPSPKYKDWHEEQSWRLNQVKIKNYEGPIIIHFYFPDNRKADMTNKAESIMDLLVDNGILVDDAWQNIPNLTLISKGIDKENPRAEVHFYTGNVAPE